MAVTCRELLTLPSLKKMKIVAGKDGLDHFVRWVHAAEVIEDIRNITEWLQGGELILITGIGLKKNGHFFVDFIQRLHQKKSAGLVVNLGEYITEIPNEVIQTANEMKFPIFSLPWEVPLVEVSRDICIHIISNESKRLSVNHLVQSLLFQMAQNFEEVEKELRLYGYHLEGPFQVGIIEITEEDESLKQDIQSSFYHLTQQLFFRYFGIIPILPVNNSMVVCIPCEGKSQDKMILILKEFKEAVRHRFSKSSLRIAVGNVAVSIEKLHQSFQEAQKTLTVMRKIQRHEEILFYQDLGVEKLILEIKDLEISKQLYQDMLGELEHLDEIHHTNLLETLEIFLDNNGNAVKTAEYMFIHRNTLKYRLDKIMKICRVDLEDPKDCLKLRLAFYIKKFL